MKSLIFFLLLFYSAVGIAEEPTTPAALESKMESKIHIATSPQVFKSGEKSISIFERWINGSPELHIISNTGRLKVEGNKRVPILQRIIWTPQKCKYTDAVSLEDFSDSSSCSYNTGPLAYLGINRDLLFMIHPWINHFLMKYKSLLEAKGDGIEANSWKKGTEAIKDSRYTQFLRLKNQELFAKGFSALLSEDLSKEDLEKFNNYPNYLLSGKPLPKESPENISAPVVYGNMDEKVATTEKVLIVTHASKDYDDKMCAKEGIDRWIAQFKKSNQPTYYLMSDWCMQGDSCNYQTDRSCSAIIVSSDGYHPLISKAGEVTIVGGFFGACLFDSVSSSIYNYYENDGKGPFTVHLPMHAIFESPSWWKDEKGNKLDFSGPVVTLLEFYQKLGAQKFADVLNSTWFSSIPKRERNSYSIPLSEDQYSFEIKVDGNALTTVGTGTKKVVLNFISTDPTK